MNDPVVVRGITLALPVLLLAGLSLWRRPSARQLAAAIIGTSWSACVLVPVNLLATRVGWWSFDAAGATWLGLPVDLVLTWALLWGAVPALVPTRVPAVAVAATLVWVDLALMPLAAPVVVLGESWLTGEAVAVLVVLVPALALTRWTLRQRHVLLRAWAQAACAGVLMVVAPVLALGPQLRWSTPVVALGVQLALVACVPGLAAMRELAVVGRGTPLPYDPPSRLVVSGPYAYVRNPMQAAVALVYLVLAAALAEPLLLVGFVSVIAYGAGLADWYEGEELRAAYGQAWDRYRRAVPAWVPRWRPHVTGEAVLYVAADCDMCRGLGAWVAARRPRGVVLRAAAEHDDVLTRLTYEAPGVRESGVAALARALGHVHLGWALAGWMLTLPGVAHLVQLCTDAFGAGPRPARDRCVSAPPRATRAR